MVNGKGGGGKERGAWGRGKGEGVKGDPLPFPPYPFPLPPYPPFTFTQKRKGQARMPVLRLNKSSFGLRTCSRASRRLGQLTCPRHRVHSTSNLRVFLVDHLKRRRRAISCCGELIAQLSLNKRPRLLQLFRRHLKDRFRSNKLFEFLHDRFGHREICRRQNVVILYRALHFIVFKTCNATARQFKSKTEDRINKALFSESYPTRLNDFIRHDATATVHATPSVRKTFWSCRRSWWLRVVTT